MDTTTSYRVDYSVDKFFNYYTYSDNCAISNAVRNNYVLNSHIYNIFDQYVNNQSVVVECGSFIGTYTLPLASLCNTLYAFEPMPDSYSLLTQNLALNNITNTTVFNKGVSSASGTTKFGWIWDTNISFAGLDNNPHLKPTWTSLVEPDINVDLVTIDSLNLNKLDFMKINVVGYESLAIEGAIDTITTYKPVILMDVWKSFYEYIELDYTTTLFSNLINLGYTASYTIGPTFLFLPPSI